MRLLNRPARHRRWNRGDFVTVTAQVLNDDEEGLDLVVGKWHICMGVLRSEVCEREAA